MANRPTSKKLGYKKVAAAQPSGYEYPETIHCSTDDTLLRFVEVLLPNTHRKKEFARYTYVHAALGEKSTKLGTDLILTREDVSDMSETRSLTVTYAKKELPRQE